MENYGRIGSKLEQISELDTHNNANTVLKKPKLKDKKGSMNRHVVKHKLDLTTLSRNFVLGSPMNVTALKNYPVDSKNNK